MTITEIRPQVRLKNRYAVYIDGKYAFSLSDTALLDLKLVPNQEVTAEEVAGLQRAADEDKLYGLTLRWTAMRRRSEWEIRTYLRQKQCPPALADEILNKLRKLDLVDDMVFAAAWVESRQLLKPSSRRKMIMELRAKHVSEEVIQSVLESEDVQDRDSLRALVAKKRRLPQYRDTMKLMAYLARQGYAYDDIKSVLGEEQA